MSNFLIAPDKNNTIEIADILEIYGNSPLFPGPSWKLSRKLPAQLESQVSQAIITGNLWNILQKMFESLVQIESPWSDTSLAASHEKPSSIVLGSVVDFARILVKPACITLCEPWIENSAPLHYLILQSEQHEIAGQALITSALLMRAAYLAPLNQLPDNEKLILRQSLIALQERVRICCANALTMGYLTEAKQRGIPAYLIQPKRRLYQLGSGIYSRWFCGSGTDKDSSFGVMLASNKSASREILLSMGLPVPDEVRFPCNVTDQKLLLIGESFGYPCVLKPQDSEQGRGVTANIADGDELLAAAHKARQYTKKQLLLQKYIDGYDYRLNIINGSLAFAAKRSAPYITGNGKDTIKELIDHENVIRRKLKQIDGISTEISIDDPEVQSRITKIGLSMDSILEKDQKVQLRGNANLSTGGLKESIDPDTVHPQIRQQCEAIAQTLRLDVCGLDYISPDISADPSEVYGAFIEVNAGPQQVPERVPLLLDNLFGSSSGNHSIPTIVIMGNWEQTDPLILEANLKDVLKDFQNATIALATELNSRLSPLLKKLKMYRIHVYSHPREPLLDHSMTAVCYLTTPELLLQQGLPTRSVTNIISWVDPDKLQCPEIWSSFFKKFGQHI